MQLVTYNIQYSKGKDGRHDLIRAIDEVAEADVIALQEVVRNIPGIPEADQPAAIAAQLDGYHWVYGPTVDLDAGGPGVRGQFGNMILSRYPIVASRALVLPSTRTYHHTWYQRGALEVVVDAPAGPLRVYSVHLDHLSSRQREVEAAALLRLVLEAGVLGTSMTGPAPVLYDVPVPTVPVTPDCVVMGDFNMLPGSAEYLTVVGEPDHHTGWVPSADRLVDARIATGHALEDGPTWADDEVAVRIDYVFVSAGLGRSVRGCWVDDEAIGSDHQPVWAELDR